MNGALGCTGTMSSDFSPSLPGPLKSAGGAGTLMAIAAMCCVQLGLAASVGLTGRLSAQGVGWLRLAWSAVIIVAIARPWKVEFSRRTAWMCALLGLATAGMTLCFMLAVDRIPLGTASALEFLGPLSIAVVQGRGTARWWALVAAAGVVALTEPWHGATDPVGVMFALGAALCWATYVLLTQRAGDAVSGVSVLAISLPVAAVAATVVVGPGTVAQLDWQLVAVGFGLALLLPVIPFSLELLALRQLTTAAFGTLMCLEPAIALAVGLLFLGQVPNAFALAGVFLVVAAGLGTTRTGGRGPQRKQGVTVLAGNG